MILDIGLTIAHALDPVAFAEDRLGFRPDDWQARLLRSTAPQVIVNNGRQTGKSTTVAALATHTAIFGDGASATGNEGFDRRFRVQTKDPATSRALIGPTLISEHLAERIPEWNLAGQNLLTWQSGKIKDPSCIEPLAGRLVYVATLLGH